MYLATPLATELTRALSASFQATSIPLWVQTTGEGVTCVAIYEYGCSECRKRWQFREILDFRMSQTTKPCYCIITLRYALLQGYTRVGYSPLYYELLIIWSVEEQQKHIIITSLKRSNL